MELKFIWVKKYKNLENIGFNFSNTTNEFFEYKNENLLIETKSANKPKIFFKENIQKVIGIVGENGSGKTNLSEFINYNLAHASNGGLSTYLSYSLEGITILEKYIFIQENIKLSNVEELNDKGYKVIPYERAPLDKGQKELMWWKMERNKYIYYSALFTFRNVYIRDNLYNISTGYLVNSDISNSIKYDSRGEKDKTDSLAIHYRNEKLRESDFILNYENIDDIISETPNILTLSIDHYSENIQLSHDYISNEDIEKNPEKKQKKYLLEQLNQLENYLLNIDNYSQFLIKTVERYATDIYYIPIETKKEVFTNLFFVKLFYQLVYKNTEFPNEFFNRFLYNDDYHDYEIDENLLQPLTELKSTISDILNNSTWIDEEIGIYNKSFPINNRDRHEREMGIYNLFRNIFIDLKDDSNRGRFNLLLKQTNELTNNILFYHYQFEHKLSSGQNNLLNFYSRMYWAKKTIERSESQDTGITSKSIVIFIDEGEITLHPEWQRVYFNKIIDFVNNLFLEKKIQLILTTHSPFVLSDIPKENLIFLKRGNNGLAELANDKPEKTFGANIHDLLSNSFFMNSSIGEFVEDKIKKIVDFYYEFIRQDLSDKNQGQLNNKYLKNRDEFRYIIDCVGDPVIKNILNNHIEDIETKLYGDGYLDKRITELEDEIKKLKERENDKD